MSDLMAARLTLTDRREGKVSEAAMLIDVPVVP